MGGHSRSPHSLDLCTAACTSAVYGCTAYTICSTFASTSALTCAVSLTPCCAASAPGRWRSRVWREGVGLTVMVRRNGGRARHIERERFHGQPHGDDKGSRTPHAHPKAFIDLTVYISTYGEWF